MATCSNEMRAVIERLQQARMSLLQTHPFYAVLLMYMRFALDMSCETAYTDGDRIAFNPSFLCELSDEELQFVLMHEVLHVALGHPTREEETMDHAVFNAACDIVVNSNILESAGGDLQAITIREYGVSMHTAPDGAEGCLFTAEQVYAALMAVKQKAMSGGNPSGNEEGGTSGDGDGDNSGDDGDNDGDGNGDGDDKQKGGKGKGKRKQSSGNADEDLQSLMEAIRQKNAAGRQKSREREQQARAAAEQSKKHADRSFDDHSHWEKSSAQGDIERQLWMQRMIEATELIDRTPSLGQKDCGSTPASVERMIAEYKNATVDWRTILNDFVQEEICDYSFSPPDRRMQDCDFFLPDFNEKDESVKNVLFMVDTSASMSDEEIAACYAEILGAIEQFGGKLDGKLGFFDAVVVEPQPFGSVEELKIIRPKGGGGTSFECIFHYVRQEMEDDLPVSIVIFTDGYAPFPEEASAMGVPVLWIINNMDVTPPWGRIARFDGAVL